MPARRAGRGRRRDALEDTAVSRAAGTGQLQQWGLGVLLDPPELRGQPWAAAINSRRARGCRLGRESLGCLRGSSKESATPNGIPRGSPRHRVGDTYSCKSKEGPDSKEMGRGQSQQRPGEQQGQAEDPGGLPQATWAEHIACPGLLALAEPRARPPG